MARGRIALIGSGELTPSMVEVHKELLSAAGAADAALFLDTPAGFQPNVDAIGKKAQHYFQKNIRHPLDIVSFPSASQATGDDLQGALQQIERGDYLLAGPGSPTYMLTQLEKSGITFALQNLVQRGGSLTFASAAALTAGSHTLPVYEIYKVGEPLHWRPGLNLLGAFGLELVVLPHWNNGEGGSHDTRFCYMGQGRFDALRALLPATTRYLGIDEHTACIVDLANDLCHVRGLGGVTILQAGAEQRFSRNSSFSLAQVRSGAKHLVTSGDSPSDGRGSGRQEENMSFWRQVRSLEKDFHRARASSDYRGAMNSILQLDRALSLAQSEFESEEDIAQARELFRELLVLAGLEMQRLMGERAVFEKLIDSLLTLRTHYRSQERWQEADILRSIFSEAGIEVHDRHDSSSWRIRGAGE